MRFLKISLFSAVLTLAGPLAAEPFAVEALPVPLNPQDPAQVRVGPLLYRGGLALRSLDSRFGGLSDLKVGADGRLFAISDHGYGLTARLIHDSQGRLAGLAEADLRILRGPDGLPLVAKADSDAEGLARAPDGKGFIIAFERRHRLARFRAPDAPTEPLDGPAGLADLPANSGIEALATLADGRLLLLAEGREGEAETRAWIGRPGAWRDLRYALRDGFRPTGAALLPGGDVLVLERRFTVVAGPAARLRRVPVAALDGAGLVEGRQLAELALPLTVDNMEGVDALREANGRLTVYLIADDNYSPLQRSLLLQFDLDLP